MSQEIILDDDALSIASTIQIYNDSESQYSDDEYSDDEYFDLEQAIIRVQRNQLRFINI